MAAAAAPATLAAPTTDCQDKVHVCWKHASQRIEVQRIMMCNREAARGDKARATATATAATSTEAATATAMNSDCRCSFCWLLLQRRWRRSCCCCCCCCCLAGRCRQCFLFFFFLPCRTVIDEAWNYGRQHVNVLCVAKMAARWIKVGKCWLARRLGQQTNQQTKQKNKSSIKGKGSTQIHTHTHTKYVCNTALQVHN